MPDRTLAPIVAFGAPSSRVSREASCLLPCVKHESPLTPEAEAPLAERRIKMLVVAAWMRSIVPRFARLTAERKPLRISPALERLRARHTRFALRVARRSRQRLSSSLIALVA